LWSKRVREAADPRLPHVSDLEVPRESVERSGATETALVSDPPHRLERVRHVRLKHRRDGSRRTTKRSLADVVLKRSCTLRQEPAGDRTGVWSEVVDESRQRPSHGGHQIRVIGKI
jgi:hypothetical protein